MNINTKYGPLNTLKVTYFAYGLYRTYGLTCGPFKTKEEAELSRSEDGLPHGPVYSTEAVGLQALEILEKLEEK